MYDEFLSPPSDHTCEYVWTPCVHCLIVFILLFHCFHHNHCMIPSIHCCDHVHMCLYEPYCPTISIIFIVVIMFACVLMNPAAPLFWSYSFVVIIFICMLNLYGWLFWYGHATLLPWPLIVHTQTHRHTYIYIYIT